MPKKFMHLTISLFFLMIIPLCGLANYVVFQNVSGRNNCFEFKLFDKSSGLYTTFTFLPGEKRNLDYSDLGLLPNADNYMEMSGQIFFSDKDCKKSATPWTTASYTFTIKKDGSVTTPNRTQCAMPNHSCPDACANYALAAGIIDSMMNFIANPCFGVLESSP